MAEPLGRTRAARDVMRPAALVLREDEDAWSAARRLFEQGRTAIPRPRGPRPRYAS